MRSLCETLIAVVILIFALVETAYSNWIIIIAAVVLLIHSFTCKKCGACTHEMPEKSTKGKKK